MIDLHTHSTASDGTDTPGELIAAAAAAGLTTIALTDHDTTGGWDPAVEALEHLSGPLTLIRGTEFSCVYTYEDGRRVSLHLLGYLFDPLAQPLRSERQRLREDRLGRGEAIVRNLVAAGFPITWERVEEIAAGGAVGRPHIGQALVQAGVVSSVTEAFAEILSSASPYYVRKADMSVQTAIRGIADAGGVSVIAHPWARRRGAVLSAEALVDLVSLGMDGMEVEHTDHTPEDRDALHALARELGVFATGSSDYHGTNKSIRLGARTTDPAVYEQIVASATGLAPVVHR